MEQVRFQEQEGPLFLRAKGASALNRRQLAVLEALLQWRDSEARRRDRPLFKVLGNKSLLELACGTPRTLRGLVAIEGITPRLADRCGKELLGAIEAGLALPESDLPVFPRGERRVRDDAVDRRLAVLKEWRKAAAAALEMDPGIVINNALLEEIARSRPASLVALEGVPGMKNWQHRELGVKVLVALSAAHA